jgi:hypothetical protein
MTEEHHTNNNTVIFETPRRLLHYSALQFGACGGGILRSAVIRTHKQLFGGRGELAKKEGNCDLHTIVVLLFGLKRRSQKRL